MLQPARFGAFELDAARRDLRKHGLRLRLPDQSFEILLMLVERSGELVTRDEIRDRLWPNGTIVEFEHSVNSAVRRLRDVLGDSGSSPRFVETVPRRGYRFREPVEFSGSSGETPRYRLLEEAGRGAMGVVYRAEDVRLGRTVALKFVSDDLAADASSLDRLGREARLAAALNHPGICTLHGLEEHEGRPCLVMEFLEGTPLSRLIGSPDLSPDRALSLAKQAAEALSFAHQRGIIHRDIKPGNLFVTRDGVAKLVDFGIAVRAGDSSGAAGGTPSYSSPEQVRGEPIDGRSDIYSLGKVLYEMVAGRPLPGAGETEARLPLPPGAPKGLERIVARCVEPDPAARYQTAAELASDIAGLKTPRRIAFSRLALAATALLALLAAVAGVMAWRSSGGPSSARRIRALAVLPLVNLTGDPAQEHLADGLTHVLASDLAGLCDIRVVSHASAMSFKGSRKPASEIAARLKVDALVEGSLSRSGDRVQVVAQLIDTASESYLWSRKYERDIKDLVGLQDSLAREIAGEIGLSAAPGRKARSFDRRHLDSEAWQDYLLGMFHLNKFTPEGFDRGIAHLKRAIEKDPADPVPYAALAMGYVILGHERFPEEMPRAKALALKSLELGGPVPEASAAAGLVEVYFEWKFDSGAAQLRRALDLNPSLAQARRGLSWYLLLVGRLPESLAEMTRAVELEPLVPIFPADLAWQRLFLNDFDGALANARRALEIDPGFAQALAVAGWAHFGKKNAAEAIAAHRKAATDPAWRWPLARTLALTGRTADARALAAEIARNPGPMDHWGLASVRAALGEKEEAFRLLGLAYEARFSFLPWDHIPGCPSDGTATDLFAPLRSDPRFRDLGRRIGVPQSQ